MTEYPQFGISFYTVSPWMCAVPLKNIVRQFAFGAYDFDILLVQVSRSQLASKFYLALLILSL